MSESRPTILTTMKSFWASLSIIKSSWLNIWNSIYLACRSLVGRLQFLGELACAMTCCKWMIKDIKSGTITYKAAIEILNFEEGESFIYIYMHFKIRLYNTNLWHEMNHTLLRLTFCFKCSFGQICPFKSLSFCSQAVIQCFNLSAH